jgi:hypothetical protein
MEYVRYNFGYMYSYLKDLEHWQEEKWKTMLPMKPKLEDYKKL